MWCHFLFLIYTVFKYDSSQNPKKKKKKKKKKNSKTNPQLVRFGRVDPLQKNDVLTAVFKCPEKHSHGGLKLSLI